MSKCGKKLFVIMVIVLISSIISACSREAQTQGENEKDNSTEYKTYCHACTVGYNDGGYIVEAGNESIPLCKECRDELMLKNGFVVVNGEKEYPFANAQLYIDDLIAFEIPDDYVQVELDESMNNDVWKAQFNHYIDDVVLFVGWHDIFESLGDVTPTIENRQKITAKYLVEEMGEEDCAQLLFSELSDYITMEVQGNLIFCQFYSNASMVETCKDGIQYSIAVVNFGNDARYEEEEVYMDSLLVTASIVYPQMDLLIEYFPYQ